MRPRPELCSQTGRARVTLEQLTSVLPVLFTMMHLPRPCQATGPADVTDAKDGRSCAKALLSYWPLLTPATWETELE